MLAHLLSIFEGCRQSADAAKLSIVHQAETMHELEEVLVSVVRGGRHVAEVLVPTYDVIFND